MARPGLRNVVVFSAFAALLALLLRTLRSTPLPSSSIPTGGSAPSTTLSPASAHGDAITAVGPSAEPSSAEPPPVADALPGLGGVDPLIAEGEPEAAATSTNLPDWIAATAGDEPPASHPVKAKLASGIYHVPGGISYERTRPDRWYLSVAAAEADGLRAARR